MEDISRLPIPIRKLKPGSVLHRPLVREVQESSPALDVMTDLRIVRAATIDPGASLAQATATMISCGVRLLFVVERNIGLIGLITAHDTLGERPIKMSRERGGRHGDLLVRDLMVPAAKIDVLDYRDVAHATVAQIVATLEHFGRQHALVVDADKFTDDQVVRGVFSATQISRQLDKSLQPVALAKINSEIKAELAYGICS